MATASALRVVRQSGLLYADPSSLSTPSGYGTCLGYCRDVEVRFSARSIVNTAEEWGGLPADVLELGEDAAIAGVLRGMDPDGVAKIFPNTSSGSSSHGRSVSVQASGTVRSGSWGNSREFTLLFAPDDTDRGQFVVVYKAIPVLEASAKLALRLDLEIGIAFVFVGRPVTEIGSKRSVGMIGVREAISLIPE